MKCSNKEAEGKKRNVTGDIKEESKNNIIY